MRALSTHGTLCLGLYRLHKQERRSKSLNKRYVINFPPDQFELEENDFVYVLLQFDDDSRIMSTVQEEHDETMTNRTHPREQKIELGNGLIGLSKL